VFVKTAQDFHAAVRASRVRRVIYYGHALSGINRLVPSLGQSIAPWQLADALKNTKVSDFDILGCMSASIAAELSTVLSSIKIGYLRNARQDNIVADPSNLRVKGLVIDPQPLYHFQSPPR
jgi:hypothetical protein